MNRLVMGSIALLGLAGCTWECQKPGALRRELDCWVSKSSVQHRRPDLKHAMSAVG